MSNGGLSSSHTTNEKVNVSIRCRPMTSTEKQSRVRRVVECNSSKKEVNLVSSSSGIGLSSSQTSKTYTFDRVFGPNCSQLDIYNNVVSNHLNDVLKGYNCTVLAYGQTGTGKTYTMEGERSAGDEYTWDTDPKAGLIPRALNQLFDRLTSTNCEFSVLASFMEIYNEEIYDLLSASSTPKLKIYDDSSRKGSTIVHGLTEVHIRNKDDVYDILMKGAMKRRTAATNLNERSSRSHSLFSVTVHTRDVTKSEMEMEELVKIGKLNLVDLAGSENIGRSGAVDKRAREAGNINTSLLTLGRCITALVDRAPHVPYRGSKLTRLLQDSLGGTTKTSIIATISPGHDNYDETMSTLDYAFRAKSIHNKPKVNQKLNKKALLKEYDDEIERLRRELFASREKNGVYMDPKEHEEMTKKMEEMEATLASRQDEINKYTELFEKSSEELSEMTARYQQVDEILKETRKQLFQEKAMKEMHKEHGEEVVNQASKLLDTAEHATADLYGVHDKVDRVKTTNQENISQARNFASKVQEEAGQINDDLKELSEQNQTQVRRVMATLSAAAEEQQDALATISKVVQDFNEQMSEFDKNNWEQISSMMDEISTQGSRNVQRSNDCMEQLKKKVFEMYSKNVQFKENLTASLLSSFKTIESCCQSTVHMVLSEKEQCEKYDTAVKQNMNTVKDTLITATNAQNDFINDMINSGAEEMHDYVNKMKESMKEKFTQQTAQYSMSIDQVVTAADRTIDEASQLKDALYQNLEKRSKINNEMNLVGDAINEKRLQADFEIKESQQSVQDYNTAAQEYLNLMDEDNKCILNTVNRVEQKRAEMVKEAYESTASFESKVAELTSTKSAALAEMTTGINDNLQSVDQQESAKQSRLQLHKDNALSSVTNFIQLIRPDIPTGNTPAKKEYKFSRDITQVPDEDQLKSRLTELDQLSEETGDNDDETVFDEEEEEKENVDVEEESSSKEGKQRRVSYVIPDGGGIPFFQPTKRRKRRAIRPPAPVPILEGRSSNEATE